MFIMNRKEAKGREYEKEGRVEITVGGSVLSMCAIINKKRKAGMYIFISMLVTVKDEYVYIFYAKLYQQTSV